MKTINKEIKYGAENQIEGELEYKNAKIKVSMFLDGDVLHAIKTASLASNQKYQSLINQTLREVFLHDLHRIDPNDYLELKRRVEILEKAFIKKRA